MQVAGNKLLRLLLHLVIISWLVIVYSSLICDEKGRRSPLLGIQRCKLVKVCSSVAKQASRFLSSIEPTLGSKGQTLGY